MATHSLLCPFLDDDPAFAYGVEFGLLWARLRGDEDEIADYFCTENQEQITLAANRMGWRVAEMKRWGSDWTWIRLERA